MAARSTKVQSPPHDSARHTAARQKQPPKTSTPPARQSPKRRSSEEKRGKSADSRAHAQVLIPQTAALVPVTPLLSPPSGTSTQDASSDFSLEGVAAGAARFFNAAVNNYRPNDDDDRHNDDDTHINPNIDIIDDIDTSTNKPSKNVRGAAPPTRYPLSKEEYLQLPKKLTTPRKDFTLVLGKAEGELGIGVWLQNQDLGLIELDEYKDAGNAPQITVGPIHPLIFNKPEFGHHLESMVADPLMNPSEKKLVSKLVEASMASEEAQRSTRDYVAPLLKKQPESMRQIFQQPDEVDSSTSTAILHSNLSRSNGRTENGNGNLPPRNEGWLPQIQKQAKVLLWRGSTFARQVYSRFKQLFGKGKGEGAGAPQAAE